jgi:hypothetical protein
MWQVTFNPFQSQPSKNPIEESVLLRLLVQILAAIACISADIASGTKYSLIALPLMTAGAIWSYQRRHRIQTWMTRIGFICAVVLVVTSATGAFLGQTIERLRQTDTLQATGWLLIVTMLLVTLQMLRCWTLYYRVNLSNSLFLSTLLMIRAATTAKSWGFVLVIGIFLALLLPALLLIYRSVLKLPPVGISSIPSATKQLTEQSVPWQDLAKIAVVSLAIGGLLALFLPHFQMSQLGIKPPNLDQISAEIVEKLPFNPGDSGIEIPIISNNGSPTPDLSSSPNTTATPTAGATPPAYAPLPSPQVAQLSAVQQDITALAASAPPLTTAQSEQIQAQVQQLETAMNPLPTAENPTPVVDPVQVTRAANQLQEQLQQLKTSTPTPTPSVKQSLPSTSKPSPTTTATPKPLNDLLKQKLESLQKQINQSIASPRPSPSPSLKPSETPLTPEQESRWTNIARVAAVLLALAVALVWYLRQQQQQQKIQQRKDQSFNKLPTIERVYLLMLTELRKTGAYRPLTQTEREFAHWVDPKYPGLLGQIIADISGDYVSWRYGKQQVSNEVASQKFAQFRELHSPFLEKNKKY